ncbi:hypothetical protein HKBW3S03_01395 [Candidatus Hakubella thermalkaliphila]|uniref:Uncharacterized protein n=1 Tax=Candidatus Hakubella thermalkaliphila TaxID=2754717 RepID=A0A6V8NKL5_9ACTN|nr:hypothetical protein HKBW3S03_01395 [Candidatus Hakubella thermalkaliphila]
MRKPSIPPDDFFYDFWEWLDTKDGQSSGKAPDDVADALKWSRA